MYAVKEIQKKERHKIEQEKTLVLVVDDNDDIRGFFKLMLPYKGFRVLDASSSREAGELLEKNPDIQLILMDMLLSGENGIDISHAIKSNTSTAHIPIILMSAHPTAKQYLSAGFLEDFIEKPFELNEIMSKIKSLLKTPPAIT